MDKKMVMATLLVAMFLVSCNIKLVESGPEDCIDSCYTGCVSSNSRAVSRCEGKCRIRCGPVITKEEGNGKTCASVLGRCSVGQCNLKCCEGKCNDNYRGLHPSASCEKLINGSICGNRCIMYARKAGTHPNRILGACYALGSCICYALWLILQAKMAVSYPCPYSSTALMATMGSIQGTIFALCMERDWSMWKLGWNIRLLTVAYAGMFASGMMFTFVAWCISMRGPLFVSVFNPLMLVLVAIAGSLVLNEHLHLGSVIGAITIVCGLYAVLWGKGKEMKRIAQLMPEVSCGDSSKPIEIVITSSSGVSENHKNAVGDNNNMSEAIANHSATNMNEVTANRSPAPVANTNKESDEIRRIED